MGSWTEALGVLDSQFLNVRGQPFQLGSLPAGRGVALGRLGVEGKLSLKCLPLGFKQGPPASFRKNKGLSKSGSLYLVDLVAGYLVDLVSG